MAPVTVLALEEKRVPLHFAICRNGLRPPDWLCSLHRVSHNPPWLGTHRVVENDLELLILPLPSLVLGLQVCTSLTNLCGARAQAQGVVPLSVNCPLITCLKVLSSNAVTFCKCL